jgi:hypothetical protein
MIRFRTISRAYARWPQAIAGLDVRRQRTGRPVPQPEFGEIAQQRFGTDRVVLGRSSDGVARSALRNRLLNFDTQFICGLLSRCLVERFGVGALWCHHRSLIGINRPRGQTADITPGRRPA